MATTTIALTQRAYQRLKKQKLPGEGFPDVVLREIPVPCETGGEILDYFKSHPVPKANPKLRAAMLAGRGRRSHRKPGRSRGAA
jgi:predicted CopG family antitoxin